MNSKILVVIDSGHYGYKYNEGVIKGYYESKAMWKLSKYLKQHLTKYGFKVKMTRSSIYSNPTLQARGNTAYKAKGYKEVVFISNHTNAYSNPNVKGVEVYRSLHLHGSIELGKMIVDSISKLMNTNNRGLKAMLGNNNTDYYGVIKSAVGGATSEAMANKGNCRYAYLIEYGFHTNKADCEFLSKDANLKTLAKNVATVIHNYFNK